MNKKIAGLKIRTTNENGLAQREIPLLWHKFMIFIPFASSMSLIAYWLASK